MGKNIYEEMWNRMQSELENLKEKDVVEITKLYPKGEKYANYIEHRYCFAISIDDILKMMCRIDTDVRLEKYGKNSIKNSKKLY